MVQLPPRAKLFRTIEEDVWKIWKDEKRKARKMIVSVVEEERVEDGETGSDETTDL